MRVLVTGGYFDASGECFIDELDVERGMRRRLVSHRPETAARVEGKGFTGASWVDDRCLLVCGFNTVHRFEVDRWRESGRLSQPDFNDLHHVSFDRGERRVYVCNTGLDAIEVFDEGGRFVGRHASSPAWFERERMDGRAVERSRFRELLVAGWDPSQTVVPWVVPSGKYYAERVERPFHLAVVRDYIHPNHVIVCDGKLAVTMLATKEVRCMRTHRTLIRTTGHPHDGQLDGELFWTTTTAGRVSAWRRTGEPWLEVESYEVFASGFTGWCRGLLVLEDRFYVGLTEIRSAPQYAWAALPLSATSTCVLVIERGTGRLLNHFGFTERERHPKLFSILEAQP